ncbi:MAG TPA: DUF1223 domain-containing protein [Caulobacteraceae bacterium]|jgi:hypothetical protein|nr:DUF1223 domain-containing protein [Caulobacteraceae bacterium]
MRTAAVLLAISAIGLTPGAASARRSPVVVELFTAQGCVSCNKANDVMARLATQTDVITLTWPVDYWDYLGWKDTFAEPEFTDRQRGYEQPLGLRDVYTPQVIVAGNGQASGDDATAVDDLIARAHRDAKPSPDIAFGPRGRIAVGSGRRPRTPAVVWLIRYDASPPDVEIKAGDNRGARLTETNVVRQAIQLGHWRGRPVSYKAPPADQEGLKEVVLVQESNGGRILAARRKSDKT